MDKETIKYYDSNAKNYVERTINADMSQAIGRFLKYLPNNAYILDFGCGSGRDSKTFIDLGYEVLAWDGSLELAKLASKYLKQPVRCEDFLRLDNEETFDGVWACASILHLPNNDLVEVLKKISDALKPGGYLYTSFKNGKGEKIVLDRFFNYVDHDKMIENIQQIKSLQLVEEWVDTDKIGRKDLAWNNYILRRTK
ncbi:MAG TPA: class I SAM-dependent methyltransferase [Bacilli bacterium]|nr:class I SAM-dependent methyltransferase [Bacilli bacterium]